MISLSFNSHCNLTTCRLGDFDVVFIAQFLKSNTNYKWRQGQPPFQKKKETCVRL
jgi:hypothetical protein